jgi:hypothetical protein
MITVLMPNSITHIILFNGKVVAYILMDEGKWY